MIKITLIHGDDVVASRKRLTKIAETVKQRGWEIINLNPNTNLPDQLSGNLLFNDKVLFILENNLDKLTTKDFDWININQPLLDINLLLFSGKEVGKLAIKKFPKDLNEEKFELPQELFKFLEIVYPGNFKQTISFLDRLTKDQPIELVFTMLARHIKDLYWVLADEQTLTYPSWRMGKLKSQGTKFGLEKLKNLISEFSNIDIQTKTSQANLRQSLDFTLLANLE
jgi:hypothetical protein